VRDHDDGHAKLRLQFAEKIEDRFTGGGIEIASGLVGEENFRAIDESAGDGNALLLATGKFRWAVAEAMCQANALERFMDARGTLGAIDFGEAERKLDVFLEGHAREKVEGLEDHADGVAAVAGERERVQRCDVLAVGEDRTGSGTVEAGDEVQESGFAGAGRAEEREEFVVGDGEREFVDGVDGGFAHDVVAGDAVELDGGGGGGHGGGVNS